MQSLRKKRENEIENERQLKLKREEESRLLLLKCKEEEQQRAAKRAKENADFDIIKKELKKQREADEVERIKRLDEQFAKVKRENEARAATAEARRIHNEETAAFEKLRREKFDEIKNKNKNKNLTLARTTYAERMELERAERIKNMRLKKEYDDIMNYTKVEQTRKVAEDKITVILQQNVVPILVDKEKLKKEQQRKRAMIRKRHKRAFSEALYDITMLGEGYECAYIYEDNSNQALPRRWAVETPSLIMR